jgi:DNA-binding transcriptional regulator YiaG
MGNMVKNPHTEIVLAGKLILKNTICTRCLQIRKVVDGAKLKELRVKKGYSLREVARRVNISASYLCDIEHNRRLSPRGLINFWIRETKEQTP